MILEAVVFRYSRPEFPYFEDQWYTALSRLTTGSAEIVGSRCCMRKGNRAPKMLSLFCFREKIKTYFLLCLTLPHYFVLEKKNCPVRPCPLPFQPAIVSILLAKQGYFHPIQAPISSHLFFFSPIFIAIMEVFCNLLSHSQTLTLLLLDSVYEAW